MSAGRHGTVIAVLAGLVVSSLAGPLAAAAAAAVPDPEPVPVDFVEPQPEPERVAATAEELDLPEGVDPGSLTPPSLAEPALPPLVPGQWWTVFSHTSEQANGDMVVELYDAPAFRPTPMGWVAVDPTLAPGEAGLPAAPGALRPVAFGAGPEALFSLALDRGPVVVSAPALASSAPQLDGQTVTFPAVAADTDLRYRVSAAGVKGELLLGPGSPSSFTFHISDPAGQLGQPAQQTDGSWLFDGAVAPGVAVAIPAPVAYLDGSDAVADVRSPEMVASGAASLAIVAGGDGFDVTVAVDPTWLAAQTLPVVLDPSLTFTGAAGTFTDASYQFSPRNCDGGGCTVNLSDPTIGAGTYTDATYDFEPGRSAYRIDLSAIPAGSTVSAASLNVYVAGCLGFGSNYYCDDNDYVVELHKLTGAWSGASTWDDLVPLTDATAFATRNVPRYPPNTRVWHAYDITGQVAAWVGGQANHGFVMHLANEAYNIGGPAYSSSEDSSTTNKPYASVTYTPPPPDPATPPTAPLNAAAYARDASILVTWQPPTSNGGAAITEYRVRTYLENGTLVDTRTVCGSCLEATVTGLTNGTRYYADVAATNSAGTGPATTTGVVEPQPVPTVIKEIPGGAAARYSRGQVVPFEVTVRNDSTTTMHFDSITDQLPAGLRPNGRGTDAPLVSVFDGANTNPCPATGTTGTMLCAFDATGLLTVTDAPDLDPGELLTFAYETLVVGLDGGCATLRNVASAESQFGTGFDDLSIIACDSNLGYEPWWSFVHEPTGPQAQASVNVANGNLVLQATDSTPIQAHGDFSYVLRRTYNSQETPLVTLPGSFGAGWTLSVAEAGDATGLGVGARELYAPEGTNPLAEPLPVVLVDRDGTRHHFTPRLLAGRLQVLPLSGPLASLLGQTLAPRALSLELPTYTHLCVDVAYQAPAGVHLGLWRYVEVKSDHTSDPCNNPDPDEPPVVLGFAAERPDRIRYEFSWNGQLLSMIDGAGVELRYQHANPPLAGQALGPITTIYEPRSCPNLAVSTCRAFRFTYLPTETTVTDPAGRVTRYQFEGTTTRRLVRVINPAGGGTVEYTYDGVDGADCSPTSGQLCSASDPRGNTTGFSYAANPVSGADARVATLTDRRGTDTTFTYVAGRTDADRDGQRRRFAGIDSAGRVRVLAEGTTSNTFLRHTTSMWDAPGATCRQPDAVVDNNLCRLVRLSLTADTADEDTRWIYNAEGRPLVQRQVNPGGDLVTTWGYRAQYWDSINNEVRLFTDTVAGSGNVTSQGAPTGRAEVDTLFAISDQTQMLTPRGNAAGGSFADYLTTYTVAAVETSDPNGVHDEGHCGIVASQSTSFSVSPNGLKIQTSIGSNSGLVCVETGPKWNSTDATETRHVYDGFGQRTSTEDPGGRVSTYTYYLDTDTDLSGSTSAGGWLKAVADPFGRFAAFGYDRAGNVVRTWDRNATAGRQVAQYPGTGATVQPGYSETLYSTGPAATAWATPWRYVRATTNQLGDLTTYTVDANGNPTVIRPPRGNEAGNASFDVTATFDANDNRTSELLPAEAAAGDATEFSYDGHDNLVATTDPAGAVTVTVYDAVNRPIASRFTRGSWPSNTSTVPPSCEQSDAGDAPIPSGRILCDTSTHYDGVDNVTAVFDANGSGSTFRFDGVHRETSRILPRDDGRIASLRTDTVYDLDGNVLRVCPPRQFTEGGSSTCTGGVYSTSSTYDRLGRRLTTTNSRGTTTFTYDAVGNVLTERNPRNVTTTHAYDANDRRISTTRPRAAGQPDNTTTWSYDPAGNVTSQSVSSRPDGGTGADGALVVDGATNPQANPLVLEPGGQYTNVTLQNGGWVTAAPYSAGTGAAVEFWATGTVTVCSTCGITVAGLAHPGGAGGAPGQAGLSGAGRGPGGGAASGPTGPTGQVGLGGGGAGHGGSGVNGGLQANEGTGGQAYGDQDLSDIAIDDRAMGSGGGGGSGGTLPGGAGGAGGGTIRITADQIVIQGTVTAAGTSGANAAGGTAGTNGGGGGGGGSGGGIWLAASTVNIPGTLSAAGGSGGSGATGHSGGRGANGRVRIDADTLAPVEVNTYASAQGQSTTVSAGSGTASTWGSAERRRLAIVTAYSYDPALRLVDTVVGADTTNASQAGLPDAKGERNARTRLAYDADGHVVAEYGPRAFAGSTADPDERYMQRSDFDVDGRIAATWTARYDSTDHPGWVAGEQGNECPAVGGTHAPAAVADIQPYPSGTGLCVTRYGYDPAGRINRVTLPTAGGDANRRIDYSWTDDHHLAAVDAPSPAADNQRVTAASNLYDANGWQVRTTDALGLETVTSYTREGLVASTTGQPHGTVTHVTSTEYNAAGQTTATIDPLGQRTATVYFSDGLVDRITDPAGNRTSYLYDGAGNPTHVYSPSANSTADANNTAQVPVVNEYTLDNLLARTVQPVATDGSERRETRYTYDGAGRTGGQHVARITAAGALLEDGGSQWFSHTRTGHLATRFGRYRETINWEYDPAGNARIVFDETSGTTIGVDHYLDGRVRAASDGDTETRYTYNGAGSVAWRSHRIGSTDHAVAYTHNDAGLQASMAAADHGGTTSWTYDAAGRATQQALPGGSELTWVHNNDDTLASATLESSGGATRAEFGYSYDRNYRILSQTFTGTGAGGATPVTATLSYAYDTANRLDSFTGPDGNNDLTWDPDGNRTRYGTTTFSYRADSSLASVNPDGVASNGDEKNYTLNAFGGVLSDGCNTNSYDGFDRLARVDAPASPSAGCDTDVTYTYDGLDRQTDINTVPAGQSPETTDLHYDGMGQQVLSEGGTDPLHYAVDSAGIPVSVLEGTILRHLGDDGTGSTATLIDNGGAVTCTVRYDPFGNPLGNGADPCNTGTTTSSELYRGGRRDPGTGSYQFGARTYRPDTASWLTPDAYQGAPSGQNLSVGVDPLTQNRYSYVNGDPINLIDPSGHDPDTAASTRARAQVYCEDHFEQCYPALIAAGTDDLDGVRSYLEDDENGQKIFALIDACKQGDVEKADGNWSTDDVECAIDPDRVRQLLVGAGATPGSIDAYLNEVMLIGHIMMRTNEGWESIDQEVGWWDRHGGTVLAIAGGVACLSTALACGVAIGAGIANNAQQTVRHGGSLLSREFVTDTVVDVAVARLGHSAVFARTGNLYRATQMQRASTGLRAFIMPRGTMLEMGVLTARFFRQSAVGIANTGRVEACAQSGQQSSWAC